MSDKRKHCLWCKKELVKERIPLCYRCKKAASEVGIVVASSLGVAIVANHCLSNPDDNSKDCNSAEGYHEASETTFGDPDEDN